MVTFGLTLTMGPVPTLRPPQEALYQFQSALEPREPPWTERFVGWPGQIVVDCAIMFDGATDGCNTSTTTLTHGPVKQELSILT